MAKVARYLVCVLLLAACVVDENPGENPGSVALTAPESADEKSGSMAVTAPQSTVDHEHVFHVDYFPRTEEEMYTVSHAIVRGTVVSVEETELRSYPYDHAQGRYLTSEEAGDNFNSLPFALVTIDVKDLLRGSAKATGLQGLALGARSKIKVTYPGGRAADGCSIEARDTPLPKVGEEGIFFLSDPDKVRGVSDFRGHFAPTGGGAAFLPVRAGAVSVPRSSPLASLDGRQVAEVASSIKRRAAALPAAIKAPELMDTDNQKERR